MIANHMYCSTKVNRKQHISVFFITTGVVLMKYVLCCTRFGYTLNIGALRLQGRQDKIGRFTGNKTGTTAKIREIGNDKIQEGC